MEEATVEGVPPDNVCEITHQFYFKTILILIAIEISAKMIEKNFQIVTWKAIFQAALLSSMFALKGRVYEAMENRDLAKDCYKKALMLDCCCYEAFNNLIQHHMLNGSKG